MHRLLTSSNTSPPVQGDTKSPVEYSTTWGCNDCGRRRASGYELAAGAEYPSSFVGVGCSCGDLADCGSYEWQAYQQGDHTYRHNQPVCVPSPPTVPSSSGDPVPWYRILESLPLLD